MDRAAKRNGASTLSPLRAEASRKWTSTRLDGQCSHSGNQGIIRYHSPQPIGLLLPTRPLSRLPDRSYSQLEW
jgi:hypothetical protein